MILLGDGATVIKIPCLNLSDECPSLHSVIGIHDCTGCMMASRGMNGRFIADVCYEWLKEMDLKKMKGYIYPLFF